jgi:hypothetical protein
MAYRDELEAALARAEAAERLLSSVCYVHPNDMATGLCGRCQRRVCDVCTIDTMEGTRCSVCIMSMPGRRFGPWLAAGGVGLLVMGGLLALMAIGGRPYRRDPESPPVATARRTTFFAEQARDALGREPCSRGAAITLARELNRLGDFAGNLFFTRQFEARCGSYSYLRWTNVYAHEQRGEWREAAGVAGTLIADDPTDADFWWWRANDLVHVGELRRAAADFAQSLARRPSTEIALRYSDLAQRIGRPCEGAFALQAALAGPILDDEGEARERRRNIYLGWGCAAMEGTGNDLFHTGHGAVPRILRGAVNGKVITFLVTEEAAMTTITGAVADRAGLVRDQGRVEIWASGNLRDAELAVADEITVEQTGARAVPVAIVSELPAGVDGLVGMSYLWRFSTEHTAEGLRLAPLPR